VEHKKRRHEKYSRRLLVNKEKSHLTVWSIFEEVLGRGEGLRKRSPLFKDDGGKPFHLVSKVPLVGGLRRNLNRRGSTIKGLFSLLGDVPRNKRKTKNSPGGGKSSSESELIRPEGIAE